MRAPIIVVGGARSGTTLTMRFLHANGMQVGKSAEINPLVEGKIRDQFYKPVLEKGGFDKLAQRKLPPPGWDPQVGNVKDRILDLGEFDDTGLAWGFKGVKGILMWKALHRAFPEARWVVVSRERGEHVESLLRTPFMTAHTDSVGWNAYLDEIDAHIESLVSCPEVNCTVFSPSILRDDRKNDQYLEDFCAWCGLVYNPRSKGVFDRKLYRTNK